MPEIKRKKVATFTEADFKADENTWNEFAKKTKACLDKLAHIVTLAERYRDCNFPLADAEVTSMTDKLNSAIHYVNDTEQVVKKIGRS